MKRCLFLLLIVSGYSYGQREFKVHPNGLIYDDSTMRKLSVIVDSLNIRFRTCDMVRPYYSFEQGKATYVEIPDKAARKLIKDGISLKDYIAKYPAESKANEKYIFKSHSTNYDGASMIEYSSFPTGRYGQLSVAVKGNKANDKRKGWIIDEQGRAAFYLEQLQRVELPHAYGRLVQYVDCMIDTTANIYLPEAKRGRNRFVEKGSTAYKFIQWAESYPGEPQPIDNDSIVNARLDRESVYVLYLQKHAQWDSVRLLHLDTMMLASAYWRDCLSEAVREALAGGESNDLLEFYAARYYSKDDALKLMRSRRVVGRCSRDQGPRYHAMNICKLSAETAQWDVFLRSHLDIMNDRFERMSDGSYAQGERKTYLKELEELDIQAVDLLIGTCLRTDNVSIGHYWGSINRVGRALADVSDKRALEERLLAAMNDGRLDSFNRLLIFYLFDNYIYNLEDEAYKQLSKTKLDAVVATMPEEIRGALANRP